MNEKFTVEKRFIFTKSSDANEFQSNLSVVIKETIEADFGSYVWPSCVVLAQYLWYHKDKFNRKSFLEIGSGTALPSIVVYKCANPSNVIITDKISSCKESFELNGINDYVDHFLDTNSDVKEANKVHLLPLTWGEVSYKLIEIQSFCLPEIILGSDCFYDPALFELVLSTVYFLLRSFAEATNYKQFAKFLCTYQMRSLDWSIADLLKKWKLQCNSIPLENFNADCTNIASSGMPGNHMIQLLEITLVV